MQPFIVIIDGPMGAGKTTIGGLVQQKCRHTALLGIDRIKWFVADFKRTPADNAIAATVLLRMADEYLNAGISLIITQSFRQRAWLEPYRRLAKKRSARLLMYQLQAPHDVLLQRALARPQAPLATSPVSKTRIIRNLKEWEREHVAIEKVFDTSMLSAETVAQAIVKEVKRQA